MDRYKRTTDIIKAYYQYKRSLDSAFFVKEVCDYFDAIKNESLSESDMNFLLFLANEAGIPQYYDLLKNKFSKSSISVENIKVITLSSLINDASLIRGNTKLHRYQKLVIDCFNKKENNRYVLTAPTSFGKTFLVYEIIKKMSYKNILLVFPAISLLSENFSKICSLDEFKSYSIHSLSEEEFNTSDKNIFIFTPERFLSFMDSHHNLHFDFAFIDEVYKIDNSFIIDQETSGENERDIAYRLALEYVCRTTDDMLLAGPYMELPQDDALQKKSFNDFAVDNSFKYLRYNKIEIVSKTYDTIKSGQQYNIDGIKVEIGNVRKVNKIANLINALSTPTENTIVYCSKKATTESYAKNLLENQTIIASFQEKCSTIKDDTYEMFLDHLQHTFGNDWIVYKALKNRIGIHHGLIPKYIQKEIINLFNKGVLLCLFSTTTITEGVNTSAKNIIITSNKKGIKPLRQFDAKNIAGRAGRFFQHYSGRVIDLNNNFEAIVNKEPEIIGHKNYDINSTKSDVDYQITEEKYLSENDRHKKKSIECQIVATEIPPEVFNCFRVVGPKDKIKLYMTISHLPPQYCNEINQVSVTLASSRAHRLNLAGFQRIINIISSIVHEEKLKNLIATQVGKSKQYSLITVLLSYYLKGGFLSMVEHYTSRSTNPKTKDEAVRTVADYVYNVFKYHLVKYLGLFDMFYRYHISKQRNVDINDVAGLGLLLQKLEYNALSPTARKVSDFGVPFKLIDCYDSESYDKGQFDAYENHIDKEIKLLLDNTV